MTRATRFFIWLDETNKPVPLRKPKEFTSFQEVQDELANKRNDNCHSIAIGTEEQLRATYNLITTRFGKPRKGELEKNET